jgi:hypothetical protein
MRSPETLQAISIDLKANENRVRVRVTEANGAYRVAVSASDSQVARAVQGDVRDLVQRLDEAGFDSNLWMPEDIIRTEGGRETNTPNDRGSTDARSMQSDDRSQRERKPTPSWIADIEEATDGGNGK